MNNAKCLGFAAVLGLAMVAAPEVASAGMIDDVKIDVGSAGNHITMNSGVAAATEQAVVKQRRRRHQPPPPAYRPLKRRAGYTRVRGYYRWDARGRKVWVPGRWVPNRRGWYYVQGRYDWVGGRYVWRPGRWIRQVRGKRWVNGHWRTRPDGGRVWVRGRWQ